MGATRPKENLIIGEGYAKATFSTSLENGRSFWKKFYKNYVQVEIGREGDIDQTTFVGRNIHSNPNNIIKLQKFFWNLRGKNPLKINALQMKDNNDEWCMGIYIEGLNYPIGCFSKNLFNDLYKIAGHYSKSSPKPLVPNLNIKNGLYITGIRSYAIDYDDPRQENIYSPFSENGMWILPVIRGYPNVYLNYKK